MTDHFALRSCCEDRDAVRACSRKTPLASYKALGAPIRHKGRIVVAAFRVQQLAASLKRRSAGMKSGSGLPLRVETNGKKIRVFRRRGMLSSLGDCPGAFLAAVFLSLFWLIRLCGVTSRQFRLRHLGQADVNSRCNTFSDWLFYSSPFPISISS